MKLRLLILLAAALAAAPASGQTIKSLGYNTTNGNIVAATNVTFTNSVGFSTNARAATRTNLGATTLGNSVFTATNIGAAQVAIFGTNTDINNSSGLTGISLSDGQTKLLSGISFPFLGGATAAATSRTNLGLGAGDNVTFSNITANGILNANDSSATPATNAAAAQGIQWSGLGGSQHAAIYGGYPGAAQIALAVGASSNALSDVATFRSTGMTVASNAVVGGTLAVTGNVTMSGVGNTAPSQTASSGSSLMTRNLYDERLPLTFGLADQAQADFGTVTLANGASGSKAAGGFELTTGSSNNATIVWNASSAATFGRKSTAGAGGISTVWSTRVMVGWWFSRALSDNSEIRLQYGRAFNATTHAALSARGVGVRIATNSVFFETHNGTTGFETTNAVTAINPMFYWAIVEAGVAKFYAGTTLVATVTNSVPTNNSTDNDFGWVMSISNTSTNSSIMRVLANPGFVMQQ
jgi:hypothetical protein